MERLRGHRRSHQESAEGAPGEQDGLGAAASSISPWQQAVVTVNSTRGSGVSVWNPAGSSGTATSTPKSTCRPSARAARRPRSTRGADRAPDASSTQVLATVEERERLERERRWRCAGTGCRNAARSGAERAVAERHAGLEPAADRVVA
jgi:hypothetical protein